MTSSLVARHEEMDCEVCISIAMHCAQCGAIFYSPQRPWTGEKYGPNLLSYIIYQLIELMMLSQGIVTKSLNQFFNFRLNAIQ